MIPTYEFLFVTERILANSLCTVIVRDIGSICNSWNDLQGHSRVSI